MFKLLLKVINYLIGNCSILILFKAFGQVLDVTKAFLWTKSMHDRTKQAESGHQTEEHSDCNEEGELVKQNDLSSKQEDSRAKCCHASTKNTDSHFSIRLLHPIMS